MSLERGRSHIADDMSRMEPGQAMPSSTLPHEEQNPDSGGFLWPHWLQNT